MKRTMKIISGLVTTILTIILLFMIVVVISSKASGGEPSFLGYQLKTVLSGSMEPTFKTGSIIAIKPLHNPKNMKKGDVITFMISNDNLATHRVFDVIKNKNQVIYKTKGDNNPTPDSNAVVSQNVVGEYTGFTIPYVGYLIDFAKAKNGVALLLIIPGLLLLAYSGFTIFNALKDIDKTNKANDAHKTV